MNVDHWNIIEQLRSLTSHISYCPSGCIECCCNKPWTWSWTEWNRVEDKRLAEVGEQCPYASDDGCAIYHDRPIMCRLVGPYQGTWKQFVFMCPQGVRPSRIIDWDDANKIIMPYLSVLVSEQMEIVDSGGVFVPAGPFGLSIQKNKPPT